LCEASAGLDAGNHEGQASGAHAVHDSHPLSTGKEGPGGEDGGDGPGNSFTLKGATGFSAGGGIVRFFFVFFWIPFPIRFLIFPFLPTFSAAVYRSVGPARGLMALAAPVGLSHILLDGNEGATIWLIQWVAMGPIFVEAFSRARSLERAMAWAVGSTLLLQVLLLCLRALEWGQTPWEFVKDGIEEAIQRSLQLYAEMGVASDTLMRLRSAAPALARAMSSLVPGLVVALDIILYWWTLILSRKILKALGLERWGPSTLIDWGMPYPWVWITIMGGIMALLPGELLPTVGVNLLMAMGSLHFLQGIGVVASFFQKRSVPAFLRGIFYGLIFLQQAVVLGVAAMGLFDIWFDFRRRWRSTAHSEGDR
jgi:uncharacterized protein YybS (DUF2232 family)